MRKLLLCAGAAVMAFSMPAAAEMQGKSRGAGPKVDSPSNRTGVVSRGNARTDSRADIRARDRTGASVDRTRDRQENRREAALRDRQVDRDRDGIEDRNENRWRGEACPPGLTKKSPACIPPGQAGQLYDVGQRLPSGYRYVPVPEQYWDDIPDYDPDAYRYYYDEDRVYVVDPATNVIRSIVDLVD